MTTSNDTAYKDNHCLLTTLAIGVLATVAVTAEMEAVVPFSADTYVFNLQTSQNNLGNYDSLKLTTQIESVVHDNLNNPSTDLLKDEIIKKTSAMFGYSILEIHESSLIDYEETFKVYTCLLDLKERDYSMLLEQEWELSESLGLYEQNTILRFV